jgi:hypothetical protein
VRSERLGRIIGIAGASCAGILWLVVLSGCVAFLLQARRGLEGLAAVGTIPVAVLAGALVTFSIIGVVVLARRVDRVSPARLASVHAVLAAIVLLGGREVPWPFAAALLAIVASQVVALRCFAQSTPPPPRP